MDVEKFDFKYSTGGASPAIFASWLLSIGDTYRPGGAGRPRAFDPLIKIFTEQSHRPASRLSANSSGFDERRAPLFTCK